MTGTDLESFRQRVADAMKAFNPMNKKSKAAPTFFDHLSTPKKHIAIVLRYQQQIDHLMKTDQNAQIILLSIPGKVLQALIDCKIELQDLKHHMKPSSQITALDQPIRSLEEVISNTLQNPRPPEGPTP